MIDKKKTNVGVKQTKQILFFHNSKFGGTCYNTILILYQNQLSNVASKYHPKEIDHHSLQKCRFELSVKTKSKSASCHKT